MKVCSIASCGRRHYSRGWCEKHYARWRAHGDPTICAFHDRHAGAVCSVDGCTMPGRKQGMCNSHYTTEWRIKNPEKAAIGKRTTWMRREARRAGSSGNHTLAEWRLQLSMYGGRCAYCGAHATTRDHVEPLSLGGSDVITNITPACKWCNSSKHDSPLILWLLDQRIA